MKIIAVLFVVLYGSFAFLTAQEGKDYYSVDNLSFQSVYSLYEEIEFIRTYKAKGLIINLNTDYISGSKNLSGLATCNILVNKEGQIEAIVVEKADNDSIGKLSLQHAISARFKIRFDSDYRAKEYALQIRYYFSHGALAGPPEIDFSDEPNKTKYPKLKKRKEAVYPQNAQKASIGGIVLVRNLIGTSGKVLESFVVRSDHEFLEQSALEASRGFKFAEFKKEDFPDGCWMVFPFSFK